MARHLNLQVPGTWYHRLELFVESVDVALPSFYLKPHSYQHIRTLDTDSAHMYFDQRPIHSTRLLAYHDVVYCASSSGDWEKFGSACRLRAIAYQAYQVAYHIIRRDGLCVACSRIAACAVYQYLRCVPEKSCCTSCGARGVVTITS